MTELKSILKQPSPPVIHSESPPRPTKFTERHRQTALHHATLIEERKSIEMQILESLEELMEFPTSHLATASNPSPADVTRFSKLVKLFQASDYDDLIEERNAAGNCGYVFCPRPKPSRGHLGTSIVGTGSRGRDVKFMPTNKAALFCDHMCTKRAMFIKVQLSDAPAWERAYSNRESILLLHEIDTNALEQKMNQIKLGPDGAEELEQAMAELAFERGESKSSAKMAAVMSKEVKENTAPRHHGAPSPDDPAWGEVEGYAPKTKIPNEQEKQGDEEDDDYDWLFN